MSLSVIAAVGGILATIVTMGETRNLPLTAAAALSGYKLFEYAQEKESERIKSEFSRPEIPVLIQPQVAAVAQSEVNVEVNNQVNIAALDQSILSPVSEDISSGNLHVDKFTFDWESLEPSLITYPAVALVGPQGSGKTTIAQHLIRVKKEAGHGIVVLDPHYRKGEWADCIIVGSGKNYKAIDQFLCKIKTIVVKRYKEREEQGTEQFPPITIVVEELTCWQGQVENGPDFIKSALSDFRKIGIMALFISHSDTNSTWGGAGGTRELRDNSIAFIKPMVKLTPLGAKPLGRAKISIPGMGAGTIDVPDLRITTPSPQEETTDVFPKDESNVPET